MLPRWFQRSPHVRLRRESWGGIAFDRSRGDLLELDADGFAVLVALAESHRWPSLRTALQRAGVTVRQPELVRFVQALERQGIVRQVPAGVTPLGDDPWSADAADLPTEGLRAPLVVHWAVTYRCNLACPFCYSESGPLRDAGPGPETRLRIIERLAAWGILEVALGGGEPAVLPDFPELLAAVRSAGMVPNVTTNGTVQRPAVLDALAEQAGVVHLSADRPDLLDAARGPGVFARLRETARQLTGSGVRLGVNLLLTPDNLPHLAGVLTSLGELQVQQVTFLKPKGAWAARNWPGFPTEAEREILKAQLQTFLAGRPPLRCYVDTALRSEWADMGWLDDPEPEVLGCGGGQRHVAVTPEGDVYPCSHARRPAFRMGNILAQRPQELWQANPGAAARQRYRTCCAGTACACRCDGARSVDEPVGMPNDGNSRREHPRR